MTTIKEIDVFEAKTMLNQGAYLLDVRNIINFENVRIENAIHLTQDSFAKIEMEVEYDTPILIICEKGISSRGTTEYLTNLGYDQVYSIKGGMQDWIRNGFAVIQA